MQTNKLRMVQGCFCLLKRNLIRIDHMDFQHYWNAFWKEPKHFLKLLCGWRSLIVYARISSLVHAKIRIYFKYFKCYELRQVSKDTGNSMETQFEFFIDTDTIFQQNNSSRHVFALSKAWYCKKIYKYFGLAYKEFTLTFIWDCLRQATYMANREMTSLMLDLNWIWVEYIYLIYQWKLDTEAHSK